MKKLILNYLMKRISRKGNYDDIKLQEIRYGLEAIYLNVSRFTVFFLINFLIGNFITGLLFFLFFVPIKSFSWGFHAKTSWQCWLISSIAFVGLPLLVNYIYFDLISKIILCTAFLLAMWCWAPADTPKRPLINKDTRNKLRNSAILITIIYIALIFNTELTNILVLALLLQCFLISPFTYLSFNMEYKNYQSYQVRV